MLANTGTPINSSLHLLCSAWVRLEFSSCPPGTTSKVKQTQIMSFEMLFDQSLICAQRWPVASALWKNLTPAKYQRLGNWSSLIDFPQYILSEHFHNDLDPPLNKMCSAGGGQWSLVILLKGEHSKQYFPTDASARKKTGHYPEGCPVCKLQTHKYTVQGPHYSGSATCYCTHVSIASLPGCATDNVFSECGICHHGGC